MSKTSPISAVLLILLLSSRAGSSGAIEVPRPTLVVYITEKPRLTKYHPGLAEIVAVAELRQRGFKILSPLTVRNLAAMCPRDVRGVWNADRLNEFRKHFNADVLWMASVDYKITKAIGAYPIGGSMTVAATAFSADTGKSLWFGKIEDHELKGATAEAAARQALAETLPDMIEEFHRDPRIRTWLPARSPQPWPPGVRMLTPSKPTTSTRVLPGKVPEAYRNGDSEVKGGYTGVILEADHLRVIPSYRTRLYSDHGRPILLSEGVRMSWADRRNIDVARRMSGGRPLHIRAIRSERGRIVLRDRDARLLGRQAELLKGGRVTVIVRPPR